MVVQFFLFVCDKRFCTFNRMVSVMSQNQCCLYYLSSNYTSLCAVCQWGLNNFGRNLFVCCFEGWKTSKLPAGQTFRKESYKVFSYFLYFTKSRKKPAAGRRKDLSLFVRSRSCGELNRGLQNLDVLCKENGLSLFATCKK